MRQLAGATVGAEKRRTCARGVTTGAPKHLRHDRLVSATTLDRRAMEGDIRLSEWWSGIGKPDGRLHRRPVHSPGGP